MILGLAFYQEYASEFTCICMGIQKEFNGNINKKQHYELLGNLFYFILLFFFFSFVWFCFVLFYGIALQKKRQSFWLLCNRGNREQPAKFL